MDTRNHGSNQLIYEAESYNPNVDENEPEADLIKLFLFFDNAFDKLECFSQTSPSGLM